jgi:hypothetical protein
VSSDFSIGRIVALITSDNLEQEGCIIAVLLLHQLRNCIRPDTRLQINGHKYSHLLLHLATTTAVSWAVGVRGREEEEGGGGGEEKEEEEEAAAAGVVVAAAAAAVVVVVVVVVVAVLGDPPK